MVATWLAVGVYFLALGVARGTVEQSLSARLAGAGPAMDQNREMPDTGPAPAVMGAVSGERADLEGGGATDAAASVETSVDHPPAIEAIGRSPEATDAPGETPSGSSETSAGEEPEFVPREFATGLRRRLNARYGSFTKGWDKFRMEQGTVWLVLPGDGSEWLSMGRDEGGYYLDIRSYESSCVPALGDLICDQLGWQRGENRDEHSYRFFSRPASDGVRRAPTRASCSSVSTG